MLPSFHIRNIRRSSSSPPRVSQSSTSESLVRLTEPEYDDTISHHPKATLKYMDDDDGELVTVGTSLELSQRLQEPVLRGMDAPRVRHTFDIDRGQDTVQVWQSIINRTNGKTSEGRSSGPWVHRQGSGALKAEDTCSSESSQRHLRAQAQIEINPCEDDAKDFRKRYTRACNPPELDKATGDADESSSTPDNFVKPYWTTSSRKGNTGVVEITKAVSYLTEEGQRQAEAAGVRMRALPNHMTAPSISSSTSYQNRWASYNRPAVPFTVYNVTSSTESVVGDNEQTPRSVDLPTGRKDTRQHAKVNMKNPYEPRYPATDRLPTVRFMDKALSSTRTSNTHADKGSENAATDLLQVFDSVFDQASETVESRGPSIKTHPPVALDSKKRSSFPPATKETTYAYVSSKNKSANIDASPALSPIERIGQSIKRSVDDVVLAVKELQEQPSPTSETTQSSRPDIAQRLEEALNNALLSFDKCLITIAHSAQETSKAAKEEQHTRSSTSEEFWDAFTGCSKSDLASPQGHRRLDLQDQPIPQKDKTTQDAVDRSQQGPSDASDVDILLDDILGPIDPGEVDDLTTHAHSSEADCQAKPRVSLLKETSGDHLCEHATGANHRSSLPVSSRPPVSRSYPGCLTRLMPTVSNADLAKHRLSTVGRAHVNPKVPSQYPPPVERHGKYPTNISVPRFPLLPSMVPLLPSSASQTAMPAERSPEVPTFTSPSYEQRGLQLRSPHELQKPQPCGIESSGQFFNRMMTGLDAGAAQFDASSISNPGPRASAEALRRSATVAGLNDRSTNRSRRPYSTNFDGRGRMPWDSFLRPKPHCAQRAYPNAHRAPTLRRDSTKDSVPSFSVPGSFSQNEPTTTGSTEDPSFEKARACAKQLRELGFGSESDEGMQRLMVYAQAAEGVLVDAIDMIDEEQKAYGRGY